MSSKDSQILFYLKSKAKEQNDKKLLEELGKTTIKRDVPLKESMPKKRYESLFFNRREKEQEKLKSRNHRDYLAECEEVTRLQNGGKYAFSTQEEREAIYGFNYRLRMKEQHGEQFYDGTDLSPKEYHIKFRNYYELSEVLDQEFERTWYSRMKSMSHHKRNKPNNSPFKFSELQKIIPDLKKKIHENIENQFLESGIIDEFKDPLGYKDILRSEVLTKVYLLNSTKSSASPEEQKNIELLNHSLKKVAGIDVQALNKKFKLIEKLISDFRKEANMPQQKLSVYEEQEIDTDIRFLMLNSISNKEVISKYCTDPDVYEFENNRIFAHEIRKIEMDAKKLTGKKNFAKRLEMTLEELDAFNEANNTNKKKETDQNEEQSEESKETEEK